MKNKFSSRFTSYMLVVLSIVMVIYSLIKQTETANKEKTLSPQVQEQIQQTVEKSLNKPSKFSDYESLKELKKLTLASNFISYTPGSQMDITKIIETIVLNKGMLSKGYIYIKASIDEKALTQWESIYMTMNYNGGHLFRPQSLTMPQGDKTELLYALNDIPFLRDIPYNEQTTPYRTNWFGMFSENNRIVVTAFISSLRPAKIEELTIYYSCGENSDCLLSKTD